jgi:hypothetical protein
MNGEQKITPEHLRRRAVIYVRQSSEGQVRHNLESQQLQYALGPRAKGLGFGDVEVLDVDLGASAAMAAKRREGFERLLGAVALGEVGLILSRVCSANTPRAPVLRISTWWTGVAADRRTFVRWSRYD